MEGSGRHVFVTGRAGTGKSTLLNYFCAHTGKAVVVLAPTGVAAINVGGQTIHSFFRFKPDVIPSAIKRRSGDEKKNIYKKLKTILIDEVSMVRADLLDCVDKFLRLNGPDETLPFGGVQMIFIGDLYQLPPVVTSHAREIFRTHYATPYFFSAKVFDGLDIAFVELEKIYRQQDGEFIRLLNAIRNRTVTDDDLALFNQRHDPNFTAPPGDFYIHLTSTNDLADAINEEQLAGLPGRSRKFKGLIEGEFGREYLPTALDLKLKKDAQIMLLNNDSYGRWVNGTIGRVTGFKKDKAGETLILAKTGQWRKGGNRPEHLGDLPVFPEGGRTGLGGRSAPLPSILCGWPLPSRSTRARARPSKRRSSMWAGAPSPTGRCMWPFPAAPRWTGLS